MLRTTTDKKISKWLEKGKSKPIVHLLKNGLYYDRIIALEALGNLQDEYSFHAIYSALDDEVKVVSVKAIETIQQFTLESTHIDKICEVLWYWEEEEKRILKRKEILSQRLEKKTRKNPVYITAKK